MTPHSTDYLVVGAGTAGLAFADTLIAQDPNAHVTLVDRRGKAGGHWNDAYPFVTLHQPSAFYGVASLPLGSGRIDSVGLNAGLAELASGAEVCAYFDRVVHQSLLASGRVAYCPMHEHLGDGLIESLLSGERTQLQVRRRIVDASHQGPSIPSNHRPRFEVADGVRLVPPNALPQLWQRAARGESLPRRFVVVGAGKTAMDSVSWLLGAGAPAAAIQWLVPRDSWLVNRVTTQNGAEFFDAAIGGQADQMQAFAEAESVEDLFLRLEAAGVLLRIHRDRWPTMFHLATMTPAEAAWLARVQDVVRLGHVRRLEPAAIELEHGRIAVDDPAATLFVDCTASAVEPRPLLPVFQDGRIVLQMLRLPLPAFSAALTAWIEVHGRDDKHRNALAAPVPFPHSLADYPKAMAVGMWNQAQWGQEPALRQWMRECRLDGFSKLMASASRDNPAQQAIIARFKQHAMAAMANLPRLIASAA
ncbi:MAG: NAD(P)-binding protein [Rubrivivax sp.]|jgi:hypothetical protein|nr:NAD(P)-binding protein [Rubrivivax sp.]